MFNGKPIFYSNYFPPVTQVPTTNVPKEKWPDVSNILNTNPSPMAILQPPPKPLEKKEITRICEETHSKIQDSIQCVEEMLKGMKKNNMSGSNRNVKKK